MSDTDATQARQDVAADVDEIIEHVINGNMLSMPYEVYLELFDAVDGLGVGIENLQSENAKLRELVGCYDSALRRMCDQTQSLYSQSDSLPCDGCVLGKGHGFDKCGIDELREEARKLRIEVDT